MKQPFFPVIFATCLFCSCSTGKHLAEPNTEIQTLQKRVDSLKEQNEGLTRRLLQSEKQSGLLLKENGEYKKEADDCLKSMEAATQRMNDISRLFDEQTGSLQEIKAKTITGLSKVQDTGIEVKYRNGMLYVSMQNLLMFPSGSTKLNEEGSSALSVIARILKEYPQVSAIIVGNTDTTNIRKRYSRQLVA